MRPFHSEFVSLRQRRYHVRIWGQDDAPTLIFLHGWGDVSASFQFIVDALQGNWRVIAPDWRGFGQSQWNEGPYWFPDYIADLDALLAHYTPEQPAQIIGHSLGGIVASLYAGIRPERVARFANLEGFGLWVSAPGETPDRFMKWLQQIRDNDSTFRHYPHRADYAARMCNDNPRLTRERAAFLAEHSLLSVENGAFTFAADPRHRWINPVLYPLDEAKACWRRVSAPTLWVAARDSQIMKQFADRQDDYQERMACFANVEERLIDDCGHNLHHDQPQALARLLDDFFSCQRLAGGASTPRGRL
ncbi:alpha/beta fold hydrolase [Propionivibrio sp.]|uniref:alpha/beta fold hydrolase n=1 Tax=Propionivibrio sp. TaxID=2212460 RepID=UPI003BF1CDBC